MEDIQDMQLMRIKLDLASQLVDTMIFGEIPPLVMNMIKMVGLPSPSIQETLTGTSDTIMRCFSLLVQETMRLGLDDQVGYDEFAEKFGTLFLAFKETYEQERETRKKKSKGKEQVTIDTNSTELALQPTTIPTTQ